MKIAVYGCVCTYAKLLGREKISISSAKLSMKKKRLTKISPTSPKSSINVEAAEGGVEESEEAEEKDTSSRKAPKK